MIPHPPAHVEISRKQPGGHRRASGENFKKAFTRKSCVFTSLSRWAGDSGGMKEQVTEGGI